MVHRTLLQVRSGFRTKRRIVNTARADIGFVAPVLRILEDAHATGMISAHEYSDSATFLRLIGNLRDVEGTQLYRIVAQCTIILMGYILTAVYINRAPKLSSPAFSPISTALSTSASSTKLSHPGLADGNISRDPVIVLWIFVRVHFFVFIGGLTSVGLLRRSTSLLNLRCLAGPKLRPC